MHVSRRTVILASAVAPFGLAVAARGQTFRPDFTRHMAEAAFEGATGLQARQVSRVRVVRGRSDSVADLTIRSIDQVAAILGGRTPGHTYPERTALLFYQRYGSNVLRSWLITADGLVAASQQDAGPDLSGLNQAVRDLRFWLHVDGRGVSRAPVMRDAEPADAGESDGFVEALDLRAAARRLSALLLPAEIRQGLIGVRHLVTLGNGAISTTPFAMLPVGNGQTLIERMTISSIGTLTELAWEVPPWSWSTAYEDPLIFGDPRVPPDPMILSMPLLPGARREARVLGELVHKDVQLEGDATKSLFMERWRTASALYVAAHGVSNTADPLGGSLLFLSGATPADAYLSARTILPAGTPILPPNRTPDHMRADLVVLSACQSGLGRLMDGGVVGMARAFNQRGAGRVVMSLWSVSDEASLALMTAFNRACMTMTPADALRSAMLTTRRRYRHPRLWAPFMLFGTPR